MRKTTLCFFIDSENQNILLALKKRGFGAGKFNGPGGKVESTDSSIESAAIRECIEEVGLKPKESTECSVYQVNEWTGELVESEEMSPQWFSLNEPLPLEQMWEDVKIWFPHFRAPIDSSDDLSNPFDFTFHINIDYILKSYTNNINNIEYMINK
ncbi:hypothetical protein PPL_09834 [Heterostelium album PN500]|uniref:Nudix hydrolase domain-containing protein n=1 Tax=Heterostelium pallidum (strain ATCC 26659 / Pp 5 / PN500) TaxID=670386 RepID=D3BP71_HETP5|nr:hypothetical protein PPL_09834 [Heterostelium album PN500]EFA77081.1 hypothetical protein PPL_09834 [Heterostelium album PN500]|eukprot:XP_020429210.1 hypothetical protein PPL_09834 [Heterostelium album PN500]